MLNLFVSKSDQGKNEHRYSTSESPPFCAAAAYIPAIVSFISFALLVGKFALCVGWAWRQSTATPTVSLNPYPERSMLHIMQEDRISVRAVEANPLENGHFQTKMKMGDKSDYS